MTPKRQRLILTVVGIALLAGAVYAGGRALQDSILFFHTPSDISADDIGTNLRLGGLVEEGSVRRLPSTELLFHITDGKRIVHVHYQGILPDMFAEGQGVIADGLLVDDNTLKAERILAKHDENYMPANVADTLRESGYWRGDDKDASNAPYPDAPRTPQ